MIRLPQLAMTALGAVALSSCGGSGGEKAKGEAVNSQILEGSASDAMIPYEKLRSEPPAAKIEEDTGQGDKSSGARKSSAGDTASPAPDAATATSPSPPEPADSPASED